MQFRLQRIAGRQSARLGFGAVFGHRPRMIHEGAHRVKRHRLRRCARPGLQETGATRRLLLLEDDAGNGEWEDVESIRPFPEPSNQADELGTGNP